MKLSLQLKLAALIIIATASSLMGATPAQDFEFQWQSSDGTFSPTFIDITAALNISISPSLAVDDFLITTPDGVWTQNSFTPNSGPVKTSVSWIAGSTLTVTGSAAAPVLTFSSGGDILTTGGNFPFTVKLETGALTASSTPIPATVDGSATGSWTPVFADTTTPAPDATSSLALLVMAGGALVAARRMQGAKV